MAEFVHEVFPTLVGERAIAEAVASSLGITPDQSIETIGWMCRSGLSVEEAGASYNRLLRLIVKPSESFAQWMDEHNGETPSDFVLIHGVSRLWADLSMLAPADVLRALGDIRATRGVLAVNGQIG